MVRLTIAADATPAQLEFFEAKIRPVLVEQCFKCHSRASEKLKAELYLDSREGILKGGESDLPGIVPGNLEESTLIRAIRQEDDGLMMPPKSKLPANVIADFEAWVKMGAPMPSGVATAVATTSPSTHPTAMTVEEGRKFWSFKKPVEQTVPPTTAPTAAWARNEVDHFILAKLTDKGLAPSNRADKRTLIRRATYDLIGLPPSPAEVEAFETDASPDAYEKLIDRLLASPHYGERWARYWLDVARYADTKGYVFEEERRYAFAYTYRDWVIRAFNEDLPYDQFLIQQIAADRLELKEDKRPLAALGFLTLGRRFLNNQHDIIDDRIDVVTRGTMALTVSCARCHDHKYDPIPTADYYSLYGVFASTREPAELPILNGDKPEKLAEYDAELANRKATLDAFVAKRHAELTAALRTRKLLGRYLIEAQQKITPEPIAPEFDVPDDANMLVAYVTRRWEARLKTAADGNDDVFAIWRRMAAIPRNEFEAKAPAAIAQSRTRAASENPIVARIVLADPPPKSLAEIADRYGQALSAFDSDAAHADPAIERVRQVMRSADSPVQVALTDAKWLLGNVDRATRRALQLKIDELTATHPGSPQRAMAVEDGDIVAPKVFVRGNPGTPGKDVPRQFPAILSPGDRKPFTSGSGRLEFARAIASKENPLTARVMVNRVWQYHFGAGLVRTPSDFGTRGEKPTHPELLDWLAVRFMNEDAWSIKKLHKRIMLSAAYQQSSIDANPDARQKDPENRLLWRMNPRRLDFESMRDSLLATSGQLDATVGGRSVDILAEPFATRRTLYAFIDRQNLPGMFRTFDFASPDQTSSQRFNTSVPQQALFMMNSPFAVEQARKLAARPEVTKQPDVKARVTELYRTVLGRHPRAEEIELGVKFIQAEESQPAEPIVEKPPVWKYGYGEVDGPTGKLKSFTPLPHFTGKEWRGGPEPRDPKLGWAMLTSFGGHAGDSPLLAVVRRWTAQRDCTITVAGTLSNTAKEGDGVRAYVISSRDGQLGLWRIHRKSADTKITGIAVKPGDTIDFVVDCGPAGDVNFDSFEWKVTITKEPQPQQVAGDDNGQVWDAVKEFSGPTPKSAQPLNAWEKYAQVLLESNEFAFVE